MNNLERVIIVGGSCTGKTTLAKKMAERLNVPRIELDALYWNPNWQEKPLDEFRQNVEQAVAQPRWVCDGMYTMVRDLTWIQATTVVWLDYSFPLTFQRALRRTIGRAFQKTELYNGNRESFRQCFCSRDSILLWVLKTHRQRHKQISELLKLEEHAHLQVVACRKPAEAEAFLAEIEARLSP